MRACSQARHSSPTGVPAVAPSSSKPQLFREPSPRCCGIWLGRRRRLDVRRQTAISRPLVSLWLGPTLGCIVAISRLECLRECAIVWRNNQVIRTDRSSIKAVGSSRALRPCGSRCTQVNRPPDGRHQRFVRAGAGTKRGPEAVQARSVSGRSTRDVRSRGKRSASGRRQWEDVP